MLIGWMYSLEYEPKLPCPRDQPKLTFHLKKKKKNQNKYEVPMCGAHEYYIHAHQFMNLRSDQNYFLEKKGK
jgi:hypothetical protein